MEQIILTTALAISMGIERREVLESLERKGISPENQFLIYQAAIIMSRDLGA